MQNGRINLSQERGPGSARGTGEFVDAFKYRTEIGGDAATDMIRGNVQANPLNTAYFSPANMQIVQNKIRKEVYERSGGEFLIDPQSAEELITVMRAMYLQYGKNNETGIREQIEELNQMVADWSVPRIISECSMHRHYLKDIQQLPVPMSHPVMMTMKGTKSATFDRWF